MVIVFQRGSGEWVVVAPDGHAVGVYATKEAAEASGRAYANGGAR